MAFIFRMTKELVTNRADEFLRIDVIVFDFKGGNITESKSGMIANSIILLPRTFVFTGVHIFVTPKIGNDTLVGTVTTPIQFGSMK